MSSAILSADDLNDFISPGVACIKPVETLPKTDDSNPYEVTTEDKIQAQNPAPASISLTDCLACSGCVTSAEAVLVSLQSHTEVLNTLDTFAPANIPSFVDEAIVCDTPNDARVFVASVSPQVRASLAATYGISERRAGNIIEQFLSGSQGLRLGGHRNSYFHYVFDTNRMRDACLVLGAEEVAASLGNKSLPKPIISSACPGWICYAEKQQAHVLPHLSAIKSPQALMGTIIKSVLSKKLGIHPSQIWHLAIMPCFDKKLEASREELTDKYWMSSENASSQPVRDVDCVITSRELLTLASSRNISLASLPQRPLLYSERTPFPDSRIAHYLSNPRISANIRNKSTSSDLPSALQETGTSGGYLAHILSTQQSLHPNSEIVVTRGRNADVIEYTLLSSTKTPILKCARYYGFKNITNLVRKLKPARASKMPGAAKRLASGAKAEGMGDYAYVEVMACPGGCTNGGGQIKVVDVKDVLPETRGEVVEQISPQSQREWLARVDEAYFSGDSENDDVDDHLNNHASLNGTDTVDAGHIVNGIDVRDVEQLLGHWSQLIDVSLDKLAYTTFRKVESDVGKKKNMGDSERIAAIAGMSGGGW